MSVFKHYVISRSIIVLFTVLIPGILGGLVSAAEPDPDFDAEAWLEDDSEFRSLDINEGELTFIEPLTDKASLHSEKELTFSESGLNTGWAKLRQCYFNISPVPETDIVYNYKQIRNFKIAAFQNIGKATAEGQVIHLHDISDGAFICITADVNVVEKKRKGVYVINSGPYYQRFLDGYYPYHVSLTVNFPGDLVEISEVTPPSQPLFNVRSGKNQLSIDTWFEGLLNIQVTFTAKTGLKKLQAF